jgi:hypothetical protein
MSLLLSHDGVGTVIFHREDARGVVGDSASPRGCLDDGVVCPYRIGA